MTVSWVFVKKDVTVYSLFSKSMVLLFFKFFKIFFSFSLCLHLLLHVLILKFGIIIFLAVISF